MKRRLRDALFMLVENFAIRRDFRILWQPLFRHAQACIDSGGGYLEYLL